MSLSTHTVIEKLKNSLRDAEGLLLGNLGIEDDNVRLHAEKKSLEVENLQLKTRIAAADQLINTPEIIDFIKALQLESAHQRQRWNKDHDAGKSPADWFWLIGYLAGKALHAQASGNTDKALHHIITTAAALSNWHAAILGKTNMRPGIEEPAEYAQPLKTTMLAGASIGHPERQMPLP